MDKPRGSIKAWLADCERLSRDIQARLGGNLSVDDLLAESRKDLEERGEWSEDSPSETPPVSPGRGDGEARPSDPGKSLSDPGKSLSDPGKSLSDPGKSLSDSGKSLSDSGKSLSDPGKSLSDPGWCPNRM